MFRSLVALAAIAYACSATPVTAQTISKSLNGNDVAKGLTAVLSGVRLHLHNHGALKGATYLADNASSIKWPTTFGPGLRTRFSIPEVKRDALGRRYAYYVNHLRSESVSVVADAETLTVTIKLSSTGPALVGHCIRLTPQPKPCASLSDSRMPAVEWLDAQVDIVLKPVLFERSLAFSVENVSVRGRFDVGNVCDTAVIGPQLCVFIERGSRTVRAHAEREIKAALDQISVKRETAAAVRRYLDETVEVPAFGVRHVEMSGGVLKVAVALGR